MGMKRLQSEICILVKRHVDQWKLSHFKFSITSQIHRPFLWLFLDLKLPNMGRKLKQSLEIPILTHELYVFTRKGLCFGTGRKSFVKYFFVCVLKINPRRKNYISGYIWHRSFIHTVKCSFLDEKFVYQSFYDAPFKFGYFLLQGKVLCFAHVSKLLARCLLSKAFPRPCRKNFISAYIWIKSFIQTVKCSFVKVPISSKFLFSYLILYLTEWTSAKEKFDLDKM